MPEIQAVIFDFDGLMVDTENAEFQAWSSVFSELGVLLEMSEWCKCVGGGLEEWSVEAHLQDLVPTVDLEWAVGEWRERRDSVIRELGVKEGVVEMLDSLDGAGIPYGIASNSRSVWVEGLLRQIGLRERFDVIWTRDKAGKPKPWPDVYLRACEELGVDPTKCWAVEDSPNGCRSARAAGMKVLGCPNDVTRWFFEDELCDVRVKSLRGVSLDLLTP